MKEKQYNNLRKNERASMKKLNVALKNYIKEAERKLNNTENYRKLQKDPTAPNMKLANNTIGRLKSKN